jgi:hypothetical protein
VRRALPETPLSFVNTEAAGYNKEARMDLQIRAMVKVKSVDISMVGGTLDGSMCINGELYPLGNKALHPTIVTCRVPLPPRIVGVITEHCEREMGLFLSPPAAENCGGPAPHPATEPSAAQG